MYEGSCCCSVCVVVLYMPLLQGMRCGGRRLACSSGAESLCCRKCRVLLATVGFWAYLSSWNRMFLMWCPSSST